jgi:hypothetical protein
MTTPYLTSSADKASTSIGPRYLPSHASVQDSNMEVSIVIKPLLTAK